MKSVVVYLMMLYLGMIEQVRSLFLLCNFQILCPSGLETKDSMQQPKNCLYILQNILLNTSSRTFVKKNFLNNQLQSSPGPTSTSTSSSGSPKRSKKQSVASGPLPPAVEELQQIVSLFDR